MRSFEEVNEKIRSGKVTVVTAEELIGIVSEKGVAKAAKEVDVVTTGTFGPMCSSGAFLNFGHSDPPIRMSKIFLNNVECYGGLAAVDTYIGVTQPSENKGIEYGGAHVIEDLIAGKPVKLRSYSRGTDCYPCCEIETTITIDDLNQAFLFNPRNAYQNYAAATNGTEKVIYTYMGPLLPNYSNVTYSTSGELSPLLKDPELRAIGIGTKVFIGGTQGFVAWEGTQYATNSGKTDEGKDWFGGRTLSVIGDMKKMSTDYIRAAVYDGYGCSMFVGIGIPIPVLDEDHCAQLAKTNAELYTRVFDYGVPSRNRPYLRWVSYEELRSGSVELNGRTVPTAPMSSLFKARQIANKVKELVKTGQMLLNEPVAKLPEHSVQKPLDIK